MNSKARFVLVLIIIVSFLLTGCSYVAYKDYYSDLDDYDEIWNLTGFNHGYENNMLFFPDSLDNLEVKDFFCRYDQQLPLGEGIQVFLKIQYSDTSLFNAEIERITSMAVECSDSFDKPELSAYATRLGADSSSEYALIDLKQQIIYFIFLQNIPKDEIEFDHKLLPIGYKNYEDFNK